MSQKYLALAELPQGDVSDDKITDIVIFPVGRTKTTVGKVTKDGDTEPKQIDLTIDKATFDRVYEFLRAAYPDMTKLWTDFNHKMEAASGWLRDLVWDENKGIIAQVKLSKEGLEAVRGGMYKWFSPQFFLDDNDVLLGLDQCIGGLTNNPALLNLKQYPITAEKPKEQFMSVETKETEKQEPALVEQVVEVVKAEAPVEKVEDKKDEPAKAEAPQEKSEEKKEDQPEPKAEVKAEAPTEKVEDKPEEKKEEKATGEFTPEFEQKIKASIHTSLAEILPSVIENLFKACNDKFKAEAVESAKTAYVVKRNPNTKLLQTVVAEQKTDERSNISSSELQDRITKQNVLIAEYQKTGRSYLEAYRLATQDKPELFKL